jgi:hypothetical protein
VWRLLKGDAIGPAAAPRPHHARRAAGNVMRSASKMLDAYVNVSGNVTFIKAPASGKDGHGYYNAGPLDKGWGSEVLAFLRKMLPVK